MPQWLKNAVFYEIYPQSFKDTNGDGIGDLAGIKEKLDYIKSLGCNALWLNPCFDSPFKDGGYDVRDYKKVAPRYGTNEDLIDLFQAAHEKGIKVLLDLVPGHTSEEHEWFQKSTQLEKNEYTDRYVWTNAAFQGIADHPYIAGESQRDACYMLNFFKCQPALNYGWGTVTEDWQKAVDDPACIATREAIKDIMRFWLDKGCDGFRVDMADSLVKCDDEDKTNTAKIYQNIREMLDKEYPEAALVAEWSNPYSCITLARFHMDFYLDHHYNGYNTLFRDNETEGGDHSYFKKDADGDINRFLKDYEPKYAKSKDYGYISMFTCNHDTPRPSRTLSQDELKIGYAFLMSMPGVPFVYYGDEIGMPYIENMPSKEGGFHRTGSRTPMQWDSSINDGFSTGKAENLYLPVDTSDSAVTVEKQQKEENSLYNTLLSLIALRHQYEDLQADAEFKALDHEKGKPFVYQRGNMICAIYPDSKEEFVIEDKLKGMKQVYSIGKVQFDPEKGKIIMKDGAFAVFSK